MPNQYTKFKAAVASSTPPEFRWRECTGKKQKRLRTTKKKVPLSSPGNAQRRAEDSRDERTAVGCDSQQSQLGSLLRYSPSGGLRVDPFRSFPVHPDRSELAVLDYCKNIPHRGIFVADIPSPAHPGTLRQSEFHRAAQAP